MAQNPEHDAANRTLLDYIARHARIQTLHGTMQKHEHGYEMERRVIDDYNLLFVTRGRVVWEIDGKSNTLTPQSLLMVPPGPSHLAYSLTQRVTLLSIHALVRLPGGVDVMQLLNPQPLRQVTRNSRLDRYLRGLLTDYEGQGTCPRQELVPGWTSLVMHEFLQDTVLSGQHAIPQLDPVIGEVLQLLRRHLADPLSLEQIAQIVGYSQQHTNRLFRQHLGVTPLQYLMQLRMNRAAELLAESVLTIHAVGQQVGFTDPYYFSRMFRQYHGKSPLQYQQMLYSDSPSSLSTSPFQP